MRLYAEVDFSSEAHELQIFAETVDIAFVQKDGEIDVAVRRRAAHGIDAEKVQPPHPD